MVGFTDDELISNSEAEIAEYYISRAAAAKNLEQKRGKQKSWSNIKTQSGKIVMGIKNILREQVQFYETLFKSEGIDTIAAESLVSKLETSLSEDHSRQLEENINMSELENTLWCFKTVNAVYLLNGIDILVSNQALHYVWHFGFAHVNRFAI